MPAFFDPRQLLHAPARELHNGDWAAYQEVPVRAANIAEALPGLRPTADFGLEPILAVHDAAYVDFLQTAHRLWLEAGREGDAIGYAFPVVGRRSLDLTRIDARLGAHSFDAATPITAQTWTAAYWSAQTALTAIDSIAQGSARHAFALCRPPGHHAGADYLGGYCYLNNAAIAARRAQALALGPVAVLDIDYHHGNGTQDIFYACPDVYFASIHADPRTDYPYYWGHADECGAGAGLGATANYPLPRGTAIGDYRQALVRALESIDRWGARLLVVSFGADTYAEDPISHFGLRTGDFAELGRAIAERGLPTAIVMEGGYATAALGANVASFLAGFG
jgi:acetoin utilization deacetylase AcuC-like enzyme